MVVWQSRPGMTRTKAAIGRPCILLCGGVKPGSLSFVSVLNEKKTAKRHQGGGGGCELKRIETEIEEQIPQSLSCLLTAVPDMTTTSSRLISVCVCVRVPTCL